MIFKILDNQHGMSTNNIKSKAITVHTAEYHVYFQDFCAGEWQDEISVWFGGSMRMRDKSKGQQMFFCKQVVCILDHMFSVATFNSTIVV